jgi:ABC-type branched-subunit amino acid transport system substrate-binding protein
MLPGFRRAFLLTAILLVGLFLLSCGGEEKQVSKTPVSTQPAGAQTPSAQKVPGVTDTEVLIGANFPVSQSPASSYAVIADAMRAYFDYVNSQGGVYGRKIRFLVGDDHYNPADAVEVVRRLVEQDQVFAIVGGLGDPTQLAVIDYLEDEGVPDLFLGGGVVKFTEPVVKTRTAMTCDYETEVEAMADYIKKNYSGKKMGIVYQSDTAGTSAMEMITEALKDSDIRIVSKQAYDWGQFDLTAQMQRLKADNPDFVDLMANPGAAASAIKVAREVLSWDVPLITSAVSAVEFTIDLAGAKNAEGIVSLTTGKMISETDDPGVQRHIEIMKQFAPNVAPVSMTGYGMTVAELFVQALKNAGPNLTRESIVEGAESIRDYCCLVCLAPVNLSPTDHRASETLWFERVENGKWVRFGEAVSFESTPGKVVACKGAGEPVYAGEGN